jgi:hypothetical protein
VALTVKNYEMAKGMSMRIFGNAAMGSWKESFLIKGPVGKGLGLNNSSAGTHVAFAAGTGILVFVDLVARMILT